MFKLVNDAGAIYHFDSTVPINKETSDGYLERFYELVIRDYKGGDVDER